MEYVHGALLLHSAKKKVTEESLTKVLEAAGIEVDQARVKALVAALAGVDIGEVIKSATPIQAQPIASAPSPPSVEEKPKKEEKKEEEAELAGLSALFG